MLHELEESLGGKRLLGECHGYMKWPTRGVYFFFEPGEVRTGGDAMRVVRVGTHALTNGFGSTLWGRLEQRRGNDRGGGNHLDSTFRLHIGAVLMRKHPERWQLPTWGVDPPSREQELGLEMEVSRKIGQMSVPSLDIPDAPGPDSDRGYVGRNSIALLSSGRVRRDPSRPVPTGSAATV